MDYKKKRKEIDKLDDFARLILILNLFQIGFIVLFCITYFILKMKRDEFYIATISIILVLTISYHIVLYRYIRESRDHHIDEICDLKMWETIEYNINKRLEKKPL